MTEALLNGIEIKEEIEELDEPEMVVPDEIRDIADYDYQSTPDLLYFDDIEAQTTQKCIDNCKIIIKDFETQLDWHLKNYMKLHNIITPRGNASGVDYLTMQSINEIIASRSLNKKKQSTGGGSRKKRGTDGEEETDSEEEDDPSFDEDEEEEEDYDSEENYGSDKEPAAKKIKTENDDEIEEEFHELVVPKTETPSDEEMSEEPPTPPPTKKRGRPAAAKKTPAKTPAKRGKASKKQQQQEEEEMEVDEKPSAKELLKLVEPKLITAPDGFKSDPKKPMVMLDETNFQDFDFEADTKTNSFVIPVEDAENLPYFIFENKEIIAKILSDDIKLVLNSVYEANLNK